MSGWLAAVLVNIGDVLGQAEIGLSVRLVLDEPQQVETGEQGGWQLDILLYGLSRVVAAIGRVGGRQDGAAGVEGGHDARLTREGNRASQSPIFSLGLNGRNPVTEIYSTNRIPFTRINNYKIIYLNSMV